MLLPIKNLFERNALYIAVFLTVIIGILSFIPMPTEKMSLSFPDKLSHFSAYFFLTTAWLYSIKDYQDFQKKIKFVFLGCFIYGIIIEVLQDAITSHRTGSFLDILANAVGMILAMIVFIYLKKRSSLNGE